MFKNAEPIVENFLTVLDDRKPKMSTYHGNFDYSIPDLKQLMVYGRGHTFAECVVEEKTGKLLEVKVGDHTRRHYYAWFNPEYRDAIFKTYGKENSAYMVDSENRFSTTDSLFDIFDKVNAILNNRSFDQNVIMELTLEEDVLKEIELAAEISGKTFDEFVEAAIRAVIDLEGVANDILEAS